MKTDIIQLQKLYADGYSLNQLQKILGVHRSTLSNYLKVSGIDVKHNEKSKVLNQNYFDHIDAEDKAYMLGFIFADGCINLEYNRLTIDLNSKDTHILTEFSNILYGNDFVKTYHRYEGTYCKLDIHSKIMCNKLLDYNLGERKTFTITYPDMIDQSLNKHFIRGLVDGDGCIYLPHDNRQSPLISVISTRKINDSLARILKEELGLKSYLCKTHDQDIDVMCEIRIKNYHQCKILLDWLYKDATIYLQRKYNLYQDFLGRYEGLREQNK